jgi:hypothetical protein
MPYLTEKDFQTLEKKYQENPSPFDQGTVSAMSMFQDTHSPLKRKVHF